MKRLAAILASVITAAGLYVAIAPAAHASTYYEWIVPFGQTSPPKSIVWDNKNHTGVSEYQTDGATGECFIKHFTFQSDGNLVVRESSAPYDHGVCDGPWTVAWASNTAGRGYTLHFQSDDNLVIYDSGNHPIWASNTVHSTGGEVLYVDAAHVCGFKMDHVSTNERCYGN